VNGQLGSIASQLFDIKNDWKVLGVDSVMRKCGQNALMANQNTYGFRGKFKSPYIDTRS